MVDELGDVLFQVLFLSLLLEERGEGDLAAVAESCAAKLIRRHPHVYGDRRARDRGRGPRRNGRRSSARSRAGAESRSPSCPRTCPALLYARKVQRRVDSGGLRGLEPTDESPAARRQIRRLGPRPSSWSARSCWRLVDRLRRLGVDPELALRAAAQRLPRRLSDVASLPRPMSTIERIHAPADPRLAGQPDGRGRGRARLRRAGPRGGAVGRLDRRVRGGRAARRRRRVRRQGRLQGRRATSTARSPRRSTGRATAEQGGDRPDPDRPRRHAQQGPARRQRDPRRLAGGRQGGRRRGRRSRSTATSAGSTAARDRRCSRCR